jgi:hypothetical protein
MNIPDKNTDSLSASQEIAVKITKLSESRQITRDQERISVEALNNPEFALLTNRVMNQGSDPESIRLTDTASFKKVCEKLELSEQEGIDAIQKAHRLGPAALEDGSRGEALWLLTASISVDETQKISFSERLLQFADALRQLKEMAETDLPKLLEQAKNYKDKVLKETSPIGRTPEGIPIYDKDLGFFAAYRSGIKAAIVQAKGYDAVGTTPDTSLAEQGLTVDKQLSPNFGLRFK